MSSMKVDEVSKEIPVAFDVAMLAQVVFVCMKL